VRSVNDDADTVMKRSAANTPTPGGGTGKDGTSVTYLRLTLVPWRSRITVPFQSFHRDFH
jgi:hypothetical protein